MDTNMMHFFYKFFNDLDVLKDMGYLLLIDRA